MVKTPRALSDYPASVAVDSSGDLYIADTDNNRIQEVASSAGIQWGDLTSETSMVEGDIYTVAGSATGAGGSTGDGALATASGSLLSGPDGIVIDGLGNLYVSDSLSNRLREVAAGTDTVLPVSPVPSGITYNDGSGAEDTFYRDGKLSL